MHCNTLEAFRQQIYDGFERSRDALFNVCNALASSPFARIVAGGLLREALAQRLRNRARWALQRGAIARRLE